MHSVCNTRLTTQPDCVLLHSLMKINYCVLKVTYQIELLLIEGCHLILVYLYIYFAIVKDSIGEPQIVQYKTSHKSIDSNLVTF